jgi:DNA-binding ferritin-like protein (Dps family)
MEGQSTGMEQSGQSDQGSAGQQQGAQGKGRFNELTGNYDQVGGSEKETPAEKAQRELTDADMEALVTLKVNGKEVKRPLKEAIKLSQLESASYEKMKKAAEIEKKYQSQEKQLFEILKTNPKKIFEMTGMDVKEFAETVLAEEYELMHMSPEQKRLRELEAKLSERERRDKEIEDQELSKREQEMLSQESQKLESEILEAWKESGLPKDPFFGAQVAFMMKGALSRGEDLTPKDAALRVKERFLGATKSTISSMDAKAIHDFFGKDIVAKIRDAEIERVTGKAASEMFKNQGPDKSASQPKQARPLNEIEYREHLRSQGIKI